MAEKGRNSGGIQLRNFAQKRKWRVFFTYSSFLSDFLKSTSSSSERSLKEGHSRVKVFLISKTRQGKSSLHFRDLSSGKSYFFPNIRLESILANDCCGTIFPWSRGEAWPANKQRKKSISGCQFLRGMRRVIPKIKLPYYVRHVRYAICRNLLSWPATKGRFPG